MSNPSSLKAAGFVGESFTPGDLFEVLTGALSQAARRSHIYYKNVPGPALLGYFPDRSRRSEVVLLEYPAVKPHVPALVVRVAAGEWMADYTVLSTHVFEERPLIIVDGDTRFLRVLLMLAGKTLASGAWHDGPDKEKWAIALKLAGWLQERRPGWEARALELGRALGLQPLEPNTLNQKVLRLLKKLG